MRKQTHQEVCGNSVFPIFFLKKIIFEQPKNGLVKFGAKFAKLNSHYMYIVLAYFILLLCFLLLEIEARSNIMWSIHQT